MKRKLQLHELAAYFPYGVKARFQERNNPKCRTYVTGTVGSIYDNSTIGCYDTVNACPDKFKLLLRPIESLTPEMFFKMAGKSINKEEYNKLFKLLPKVKEMYSDGFCVLLFTEFRYEVLQRFFENHIDVFSLIPRGLATPIKD